jgi:hypothetical protein
VASRRARDREHNQARDGTRSTDKGCDTVQKAMAKVTNISSVDQKLHGVASKKDCDSGISNAEDQGWRCD